MRLKKYCLKMLGSRVLPDLLETIKSVFGNVDLMFERLHLGRISGIQHVQSGEVSGPPEGHAQDFRTETRPAHAEQQNVLEAALLNLFRDLLQLILLGELLVHDIEPSQPVGFVAPSPQRCIALPQALHLAARLPVGNGRLHRRSQRFRQGSLQSAHDLSFLLRAFRDRRQQFVEGIGKQLDAVLGQFVGHFFHRDSRARQVLHRFGSARHIFHQAVP